VRKKGEGGGIFLGIRSNHKKPERSHNAMEKAITKQAERSSLEFEHLEEWVR